MKRSFEIPAGDAFTAIRRFFAQAGEQLIFRADQLADVKTNAVHGNFTPREALERMFSRTALTVKQDEKTGALAIIPTPVSNPLAGNSSDLAPSSDLQSIAKKKAPKA